MSALEQALVRAERAAAFIHTPEDEADPHAIIIVAMLVSLAAALLFVVQLAR